MAKMTPLAYLDRALATVTDLGIKTKPTDDDPIVALLDQIALIDHDKVAIIGRTLAEASTFNEIVRNEVAGMEIGNRYNKIVDSFKIRSARTPRAWSISLAMAGSIPGSAPQMSG